jgi:hypothetical protein
LFYSSRRNQIFFFFAPGWRGDNIITLFIIFGRRCCATFVLGACLDVLASGLGKSGFRLAFLLELCFKRFIGWKNHLVVKFLMTDSPGDAGVVATNYVQQRIDILARRNTGNHLVKVKIRVMC